jgi:hypothetical protein
MQQSLNLTNGGGNASFGVLGTTLLASAGEREQTALQRLVRIKENIQKHALQDFDRL